MNQIIQYIDSMMSQLGIKSYEIDNDVVTIPSRGGATNLCTDFINGYYLPILDSFLPTITEPIFFRGDCEMFQYNSNQKVSSVGVPLFYGYLQISSEGIPTMPEHVQIIKIFPKNT